MTQAEPAAGRAKGRRHGVAKAKAGGAATERLILDAIAQGLSVAGPTSSDVGKSIGKARRSVNWTVDRLISAGLVARDARRRLTLTVKGHAVWAATKGDD